jgi:hypothetical protein
MLQILSQTNLDLIVFIGNDEPDYKVVALNLGLFKKGYRCDGVGAITKNVMHNHIGQEVEGYRTRFTKSEEYRNYSQYGTHHRVSRSFFRRNFLNKNSNAINLSISRGIHSNNVEINYEITPSPQDNEDMLTSDIISKYSNHVKLSKNTSILPNIYAQLDIHGDDFKVDETAELHIDIAVNRVREFENNFLKLYPLLVLRNFTGMSNSSKQKISLIDFGKILKYDRILEEVSIPARAARNKFIELCEIFNNNTVLTKLKANNFEFLKNSNRLIITLFGIQLINEEKFKFFKYFDHPGINFCADFLDKSKTFDSVESKISREIITRI